MAGLGERVRARVDDVRRRRPLVDHLVRMQEHYGRVQAGQQAGAVTYFGFLSFFPILALSFFVVGWISRVYAGARQDLTEALNGVMPGLIGSEQGQATLGQIEKAAGTLGIIGAVLLLYSGLGWLSAMRAALVTVFETPEKEQPGFIGAKLRDLLALVLIGLVLFVAVVVAGLVGGFSGSLLDWAEVDVEISWLVTGLTVVLGLAANMLLFVLMFRLLAEPHVPRGALWQGAALGALAFELLKQASGLLLRVTQGSPAFQAFGIALIVLVWINYFSRIVLYAAAFSWTAPSARALRGPEPAAPVQGPPSPPVRVEGEPAPAWVTPYVAGALSTLGLMAILRNRATKRGRGASDRA
jgi:membrane protein